MKKNLFFAIVSLALLPCSCYPALNLSAPKFTSTDKLLQVQPGNSYDVVVQTLGCEPYNLLSNQKDGYLVCVYKYKLVEREFKADAADAVLNQRGGCYAALPNMCRITTRKAMYQGGKDNVTGFRLALDGDNGNQIKEERERLAPDDDNSIRMKAELNRYSYYGRLNLGCNVGVGFCIPVKKQ